MSTKKSKTEKEFKLPRYLKLNKGAMFFDDDPDDKNASGIRIFALNKKLVGRTVQQTGRFNKDGTPILKYGPLVEDAYKNNDLQQYGYVDEPLPWYIDISTISQDKLSRIIKAFQNNILVAADPEKELEEEPEFKNPSNFVVDKRGDRTFVGKNQEMYRKLQNLSFKDLREFVSSCPINNHAKENLIDLYHYEQRGYNPLSRPRLEVLDLIKNKLNEYGPGISAIRINED